MFAGRRYEKLQQKFENRLAEPGRQLVLYGDTGVGKTSLVRHILEERKISNVSVECGQPFEVMLKEALAKAGLTEDSMELIEKKSAYAGVRGTLGFLFAGGRHGLDEKETKKSYPISIQTAVVEALSIAGVEVLFLDNFENLRARKHGAATAIQIAQLMKSASDRDGGVKVVVAGIPTESQRLLTVDEATGRRTTQIPVLRMQDDELDEILDKGGTKLGITFDADCRATIIRFSDGFPYYTHLHALHAVRHALKEGGDRVELQHFTSALHEILEDADLTLQDAYTSAIETGPKATVQTRKSIMEALARLEKQEVTFREIKESFQRDHPDYSMKQLDFINPHLGELVEKYGILQGRGVKKSADRTYRFANPLMRAYVKLQAESSGESASS